MAFCRFLRTGTVTIVCTPLRTAVELHNLKPSPLSEPCCRRTEKTIPAKNANEPTRLQNTLNTTPNRRPHATMRTIRQAPVFRVVRSQRHYSSARELWKERLGNQRQQQQSANDACSGASRRGSVEVVAEQRESSFRDDPEVRGPIGSDWVPLKNDHGQDNATTDNETSHRQRIIPGPL